MVLNGTWFFLGNVFIFAGLLKSLSYEGGSAGVAGQQHVQLRRVFVVVLEGLAKRIEKGDYPLLNPVEHTLAQCGCIYGERQLDIFPCIFADVF